MLHPPLFQNLPHQAALQGGSRGEDPLSGRGLFVPYSEQVRGLRIGTPQHHHRELRAAEGLLWIGEGNETLDFFR